jgi:hypothetical protein
VRALAEYILRGPLQVSLVATTCALLALLSPVTAPLSYLSGSAVALVTLRQGGQRGLLALFATALATALLGELVVHSYAPALVFAIALWLPLWLLAMILHYTRSLALAVQLGGLLGLVWVAAMYAWLGDPAHWWRDLLQQIVPALDEAEQRAGLTGDVGPLLDAVAAHMTGALAAVLAASSVLNLMLARWWQAVVFNPGGFREEFQALRLGRPAAVAAAVLVVGALSAASVAGAMAGDMLWVATAVYLLAGLGLVHGVVARVKAHVGWLIGVYAVLTVAPVYGSLVVALAGYADSWLDLRRFFPQAET